MSKPNLIFNHVDVDGDRLKVTESEYEDSLFFAIHEGETDALVGVDLKPSQVKKLQYALNAYLTTNQGTKQK